MKSPLGQILRRRKHLDLQRREPGSIPSLIGGLVGTLINGPSSSTSSSPQGTSTSTTSTTQSLTTSQPGGSSSGGGGSLIGTSIGNGVTPPGGQSSTTPSSVNTIPSSLLSPGSSSGSSSVRGSTVSSRPPSQTLGSSVPPAINLGSGAVSLSSDSGSGIVTPTDSGGSFHVTLTNHYGSGNTGTGVPSTNGNANGTGLTAAGSLFNHKLSTGAVVGIVISLLVVLGGILIFCIRQRHRAKRIALRERWMGYGFGRGAMSYPNGGGSTRSSFASPDVSRPIVTPLYLHNNVEAPEHTTRTEMSHISLPPVAVVVEHNGGFGNRNSVYSIGSESSGGQAGNDNVAYLSAASAFAKDRTLASPISVRPFTPSESWSFPQPPSSVSTPAVTATDPFADIEVTDLPNVETIKRPFLPTMDDELPVVPGERIQILNTFDDGWAMVYKMDTAGGNITGLIPIDCLRAAGEELPAFMASKRASSYGEMYAIANAY